MSRGFLGNGDSVNSKRTLALFLIVLFFFGFALSLRATVDYYDSINTQPDPNFVSLVDWYNNNMPQKNATIYSDYPYYRSLIFPGLTVQDELTIADVISNRILFSDLRQYKVDYIFVHNPESFLPDIFTNNIFTTIHTIGTNSIVSVNQTRLKDFLNNQPLLLEDASSALNERFESTTGLDPVSYYGAYNVSATTDSLDMVEGNASAQITFSSKNSPGTATFIKNISQTDLSGEHFVFWVKPSSQVIAVGFELRDNLSQRVELWEWQSYFYTRTYLKEASTGWFPLYVNVGEAGDSTHYEQGSGNVSRITQILFKCVAPSNTENASAKFDEFSHLSRQYQMNVTVQDSTGNFLAPAQIDVHLNNSVAYSYSIGDGGCQTLAFPIGVTYTLSLTVQGTSYGEFLSRFASSNIAVTVTVINDKLSVNVSDLYG